MAIRLLRALRYATGAIEFCQEALTNRSTEIVSGLQWIQVSAKDTGITGIETRSLVFGHRGRPMTAVGQLDWSAMRRGLPYDSRTGGGAEPRASSACDRPFWTA